MTLKHDTPPTQGGVKNIYRANRSIIHWTILGIMVMTALLCWLLLGKDTLLGAYYYALYSGRALLQPAATMVQTHWQGVIYTSTLGEQVHNPVLADMFTLFTTWFAIIFGACTTLGLIFMATDPRFRVKGKPLSILNRTLVSVGLLLAFYSTLTTVWQPSYPPVLTTFATKHLVTQTPLTSTPKQTAFRCDGRTHCSQMNSRAEAVYFINHCPNTKMDGDNNGIPCENDSRW